MSTTYDKKTGIIGGSMNEYTRTITRFIVGHLQK